MQFTASRSASNLRGLLLIAALLCASGGQAAVITLFDIGINIDGAVSVSSNGDDVSGVVADEIFSTGIGSITLTLDGAGTHHAALFVDHEIDEAINTYFNEEGAASGTPAAGQSWEIDEPGYCPIGGACGDIFWNFEDLGNVPGVNLDGSNGLIGLAEDVSMALGWTVDLLADQFALITFNLDLVMPDTAFFLSHSDPDSDVTIYFYSSLEVFTDTAPVPEPSVVALLTCGLLCLALVRLRRSRRQISQPTAGTSSGTISI